MYLYIYIYKYIFYFIYFYLKVLYSFNCCFWKGSSPVHLIPIKLLFTECRH